MKKSSKKDLTPANKKAKSASKKQKNLLTVDGSSKIAWDKIRAQARDFSNSWKHVKKESAEKQTFWNDFFKMFGIVRQDVANFEHEVTMIRNKDGELMQRRGSLDLLYPGVMGVEHKSSAKKGLNEGEKQLMAYLRGLPKEEKPNIGVVCNFRKFRVLDLKVDPVRSVDFSLSNLAEHIHLFGCLTKNAPQHLMDEISVDREAAELMGELYDTLQNMGYGERGIDKFLVRLLFCLFAEDTNIFNAGSFRKLVEERSRKNGSNLGEQIRSLFCILDSDDGTPLRRNADRFLAQFRYINGRLFYGTNSDDVIFLNGQFRDALLEACQFDWSSISPEIFGSIFQSVKDRNARRSGGEHYTSEENILKTIRPLFLDELHAELEKAGTDSKKLHTLWNKISEMFFLDPACGCGNFLIVAYKEIRKIEMKIMEKLPQGDLLIGSDSLSKVKVNQFAGFEISRFPAEIAQTAMWLVDHQMNQMLSKKYGTPYTRIPLKDSATIITGNALKEDWATVLKRPVSFIFGNPPFVGKQSRTSEQRKDMKIIFDGVDRAGNLDYVAAWFMKAARYIKGSETRCAFVATNSITQGEQVPVLWGAMQRHGVTLHFAYQSFKWENESKDEASVYVVIIGFGMRNIYNKYIYKKDKEWQRERANNINGYLQNAPNVLIEPRKESDMDVPSMVFGSMPNDGGHLLFSDMKKRNLVAKDKTIEKIFRPAIGADEYMTGRKRWCLWLLGDSAPPPRFN